MEAFEFPYLVRYTQIHRPLISFMFAILSVHTFFHAQASHITMKETETVPLSTTNSLTNFPLYDHTGVTHQLEECINFYQQTLELENTVIIILNQMQ